MTAINIPPHYQTCPECDVCHRGGLYVMAYDNGYSEDGGRVCMRCLVGWHDAQCDCGTWEVSWESI